MMSHTERPVHERFPYARDIEVGRGIARVAVVIAAHEDHLDARTTGTPRVQRAEHRGRATLRCVQEVAEENYPADIESTLQ
jgi:hypothetical protein